MRRLSLTSVWLLAAFCLPAALHAAEEATATPAGPAAKDTAAKDTQPEVSAEARAAFRSDVDPLLKQHCLECHTGADPTGGVAFDELFSKANVAADREAWETLAKKLHSGEMPPEGEPTLEPEKRNTITGWIDGQLANSGCGDGRDPGRVTIRRLNRNEYNNTIRDLLGIDFHPADDFPSDDVGYGFDNNGDVLSMPPILLEKYLAAAEKIATRALGEKLTNLVTENINGGEVNEHGVRIVTNDAVEVKTPVRLFGSGDFIFRVKAFGDQAGDEPVRMAVYLDKKLVRKFDVRATEGKAQVYEGRLNTRGGKRLITIRFENDFYDESVPAPNDRNLYIESIELTGPYPPTLKKLIPREHTPEDKLLLAREIVSDVMRRAYRRPVTEEEIKRVLALVEMADRDGENFNNCIGLALQAILVSPNFLFRVELDPEKPDEIRTLNDFELATRLSYFLWSSMPDDELMTLARLGQLRSGDNLQQQVRRMLADDKSRSLVENFAGQWLQLRNLKLAAPDKGKYPAFDEALRQAMQKETELFFTSVMREDRSVLEFLNADYTFLNERLAAHYGVADVKGEEFRRVSLDPEQRGGVLTQASVLTVTSNPTRTSPVKRGKWVLENLFGTPPPPPPPDVPELKDDGAALTGSLRQRTEQHRANPACAVCHVRMDPLGFGLENFDGIGGWRTKDGDFDIDASGELPGGAKFNGPRELKAILLARQDDFVHCLAEKMLTYALGRGVEYSDRCTVEDIATAVKQNDHKFASMILAIVESDAFQKRRGKRSE